MLKCSEFLKTHSTIKTLKEMSELCGVQVRTLQNWYANNQRAFICMMLGAEREKESLDDNIQSQI